MTDVIRFRIIFVLDGYLFLERRVVDIVRRESDGEGRVEGVGLGGCSAGFFWVGVSDFF